MDKEEEKDKELMDRFDKWANETYYPIFNNGKLQERERIKEIIDKLGYNWIEKDKCMKQSKSGKGIWIFKEELKKEIDE